MIKKLFLGLGLSVLSLVGFSIAGKVQPIGLDGYSSMYDNNYNITFIKGGGLISNYLGSAKGLLAFKGDTLFWWAENGQPYFYHPDFQGFFGEFWACDELTGLDSVPTNCTSQPISGDYSIIFKNFFNNVVAGDYAYYNFAYTNVSSSNGRYLIKNVEVCWSSHSVGSSLCFRYQYGQNSLGPTPARYGSLVNSQNLSNVSFTTISQNWLSYAPGQAGYGGGGNIEGSSNLADNTYLSGNVLFNRCTNQYIINKLRYIYGSDLDIVCYAGSTDTGLVEGDMSGFNGTPKAGFNFRELYQLTSNGYSSWSDWFNSHSDAMVRWKQGRLNANPFLSQPVALYSYFDLLFQNGFIPNIADADGPRGMGPYFILNYCKLAYTDLNSVYQGNYFSTYCDDLNYTMPPSSYSSGDVGSVSGDDEVLPPGFNEGGSNGSGVTVSVDWSGVLSGDVGKNFDGTTFINDYYQKLQSSFQKPINGLVGIVPGYILVFLLALILFRFLSH